MTKQFYRYTLLFLLTCFSISVTATAQTVNIPDPNLRAAVERELGVVSGATITTADMANLTRLVAPNADISDLTGLEGATNLTDLDLGTEQVEQRVWRNNNSIADISALQGLTKLEVLDLERNSITDISIVAGLTNLTELFLRNNLISDISPLAGLNKLTTLNLDFNGISNISSLAGLTNLEILTLTYNNISDISPLAGLNQLVLLGLTHNSISDLSPLVANRGLGSGNFVIVSVNPLNFASINTHIPDLQRRGVIVEFDAVVAEPVDIPDPNLRAAIERGLGVVSGATIMPADMENLTHLTAPNANISNLTGLEGATNLIALWLWDNSISGISPLEGLNNLTNLRLSGNSISDILPLEGLHNLTYLSLSGNSISDISPLEGLNNLTTLNLEGNSISDISPLEGLNNLTGLFLRDNSISDISPLEGLNNLTHLNLGNNFFSDISALSGLTNLRWLFLRDNSISDLSPLLANTGLGTGDQVFLEGNPLNNTSVNTHSPTLQSRGVTVEFNDIGYIPDPSLRAAIENKLGVASGDTIRPGDMETLTELIATHKNIRNLTGLEYATKLKVLDLRDNSISDILPLARLTNLTTLRFARNNISDISPVARLTNLTELNFRSNSVSDIAPVTRLTNLRSLWLNGNSISDISPLAKLTELTELRLDDNSISDISPLVANTGLGTGDEVNLKKNPLSHQSLNTYIPTLQNRGVEVLFEDLKPTASEYTLSIPAGISLIHVPLAVTEVNGAAQTIRSISDLYDVLGGASTVTFLITYDPQAQEWYSYFGPSDKGGPADRVLTDDIGIIAGMTFPRTTHFSGNPLGTDGTSTIILNQGLNLVGLPLNDSRINRVSDLFTLDGIGGNVPVIILTDGGEFKAVGRAGDPGDIPITGGQAFILTAQRAATVTVFGDAWANDSGTAAAPPVTRKGIEIGDTTPVLGLRGSIVDEGTGLNNAGFRVTVKNLSTGRAVATVTTPDEAGYRSTVVDIETGRAATVGDILEISAQSPNPFVGVEPLRYTVTAEDVKRSLIQLPELVAYEIPAETELLANYPNPFNPETWIPYRLAEDAFVTLTIYDLNGQIVRTIDVGHQTAAVYESRSKAIYWDGRNGLGEQVASGVYFYHLSAGDYSATRRLVILK